MAPRDNAFFFLSLYFKMDKMDKMKQQNQGKKKKRSKNNTKYSQKKLKCVSRHYHFNSSSTGNRIKLLWDRKYYKSMFGDVVKKVFFINTRINNIIQPTYKKQSLSIKNKVDKHHQYIVHLLQTFDKYDDSVLANECTCIYIL